VIEERTFRDHPERIPDLAAELVAVQPDVLLAGAGDTAKALAHATDSIPIVFAGVDDPVTTGLIRSYARPGGNVTGTTRSSEGALGPKLLDLLRQIVQGLTRVAVVFELRQPAYLSDWQAIEAAAPLIGIEAQRVDIASAGDLAGALEAALASHPQALIVDVGGGTIIPATNQPALSAVHGFALQHGLPTASRDTTVKSVGGLLYYAPNLASLFRRAASHHVDSVLRGAKPADLPVEGPTVFELIVNRTTAKTLGLIIPPDFSAQVTEWVD
jgi:putative ABC transport system substrate-binding protein